MEEMVRGAERKSAGKETQAGSRLWSIFRVMFKIGCITFGGGWSIIAQLQEEFVDRRHWMEEEELVDYISIGRSLPGIMIINISVLSGYRMAGFFGAVSAAFGLSLPAIICIAIVTMFYTSIKDNVWAAKALNGVRCAVIPIILAAAVRLKDKSLTSKIGYVLAVLALAVCTFTDVNKILVVVSGGAAGLLLLAVKRRGERA